MRLRDLIDESVVKVGLESLDKEECFEEMIDLLVRAERLADRAGALEAIRQREAQGTTGIGQGVAIPHGKHASISSLTAALGVSADGIEFDSIDGDPAHAEEAVVVPVGVVAAELDLQARQPVAADPVAQQDRVGVVGLVAVRLLLGGRRS